jgi:predicted ArsR family transcriptional regulator
VNPQILQILRSALSLHNTRPSLEDRILELLEAGPISAADASIVLRKRRQSVRLAFRALADKGRVRRIDGHRYKREETENAI